MISVGNERRMLGLGFVCCFGDISGGISVRHGFYNVEWHLKEQLCKQTVSARALF